jgi:hypothetical protein
MFNTLFPSNPGSAPSEANRQARARVALYELEHQLRNFHNESGVESFRSRSFNSRTSVRLASVFFEHIASLKRVCFEDWCGVTSVDLDGDGPWRSTERARWYARSERVASQLDVTLPDLLLL